MVFGWGKLDSIMRNSSCREWSGWTGCFACWRQPTIWCAGWSCRS